MMHAGRSRHWGLGVIYPVLSRQTEPFSFLFKSLVQQFYRHQKVTYEAVKRNKTS